MLLEFRVGNFLSFNDVQTIRTSDLRQTTEGTVFGPCVPLMLLYGPNSSGKSNLLRAVSFARNMLLATGRGFRDLRYGAYRGSPSEKDSYFEFVIRTDRTYAVGFEMDLGTHTIKHEWLYVLGEDGDRCVYDEKGFDGPSASRLNDAAESGIPEADSVSSWLRDSLFIVTDDNMTLDVPVGDGFLHTLGTALSRLDTGIRGVVSLPAPVLTGDACGHDRMIMDIRAGTAMIVDRGGTCSELGFDHGHGVVSTLGSESHGTARIVLILSLMSVPTDTRTVLLDDVDISLHRLVARHLLSSIGSAEGMQMICTTHDTDLLRSRIVDRNGTAVIDSIGNRGRRGSSIRCVRWYEDDSDVYASYVDGRFGSLPIFSDPIME